MVVLGGTHVVLRMGWIKQESCNEDVPSECCLEGEGRLCEGAVVRLF
jgi:hypothetical protein